MPHESCPVIGDFGHVYPGPSYDRRPCACGKPYPVRRPAEAYGYEPRRAVLCTCGWARIFHNLATANTAIDQHMIEGTEGCDHAVQILDAIGGVVVTEKWS